MECSLTECRVCDEFGKFVVTDDKKGCRKCDPALREYYENATCAICPAEGFLFEGGECSPCVDNCVECVIENQCRRCNQSEFYVLTNTLTCEQCDESKREFYDNGICGFCLESSFYLEDNECKPCIEGCRFCENG